MKTLDEWIKEHDMKHRVERLAPLVIVTPNSILSKSYSELWELSDYTVSSVSGGVVHLLPKVQNQHNLLLEGWSLLRPGEYPDKLEPDAGGWRYGSIRWESGEAAVYWGVCLAVEKKLLRMGCHQMNHRWHNGNCEQIAEDMDRLTAAVNALTYLMKGK